MPYLHVFSDLFLTNFRFEATVGSCDSELKPILEKVLELYLVSSVERNLAQLLTLELIKPEQVRYENYCNTFKS